MKYESHEIMHQVTKDHFMSALLSFISKECYYYYCSFVT